MAAGQSARLDPLFERLKNVDAADAPALEAKIRQEWSKSGSPAADLLLSRAKIAIDAGDHKAAMGHLTALNGSCTRICRRLEPQCGDLV